MAKKKTEEKEIRHAGDPNVMGLRGAVVEQPITDTLDEQLYALRHDASSSPAPSRRSTASSPPTASCCTPCTKWAC